MARQKNRVSVIIPAYNAERTLDETLLSARSQSHRGLEIIVVDDGSVDSTVEIAQRHAAEDPRVRVLQQGNAGVAAARNMGIAAATGEYIAPLDADDLWHPRKIEWQLEVFAREGPEVGVVYTWYALIDHRSRIERLRTLPIFQGDVLADLAHFNFIGNGSSPLIREHLFKELTGYDTTLRARGGEGCEDWKFYFELAERCHFGVIPAPLTGYRVHPENMSSNGLQMLKSRDLAISDLLLRHPDLSGEFRIGRNRLSGFLLHRALRRLRVRQAFALASSIAGHDLYFLFKTVGSLPVSVGRTAMGRLLRHYRNGGRPATFAEMCGSE
ncbi:glycosyltransferase family A protein [Allopontixanthobacter sp.]|uniref:glycosyltransferase family 2 protein n=1 Tax=Allopontixanthobacter sp. TaxID=2906452 RepID=UPI002ABAE7BE|nr:glycosyltransferase family A protein [Allopontixanthobacter sp.]MDZ4306951.1 glycosyltransferase family A protein [Allopontixanthobacter sp.]